MVNYKCDRCGFVTTRRNNFKNHLFRKHTCKAILEDIPIETIREKYGFFELSKSYPKLSKKPKTVIQKLSKIIQNYPKKYKCSYCDKEFKFQSGKIKHEKKNCKVKKAKEEEEMNFFNILQKEKEEMKKEMEKKEEQMKKEMEKKDEQIKAIMEHMEKLLEKVGNTTITQNNNIQLNSYGKENMKYLKDNTFIKLLEAPFNSIPRLVRKIHFNKKHPENQNIRITNKKLPYAEVYKNDKWEIRDKKETIMDLVEVKKGILDERYEELKGELMDYKQENYEDYIDKRESDKWTKKLQTKTELEILNGCKNS